MTVNYNLETEISILCKINIFTKEEKELLNNMIIIRKIKKLSNRFTKIINRSYIINTELDWGNNGIGDRFAKKLFNYTVIYNNKTIKTYSENDDDKIPSNILDDINNINGNGIIGIFIHSLRSLNINRTIKMDIKKKIKKNACVNCGSTSDIICDHKNDLYNDNDVLILSTQKLDNFQSLCNHCNLQKRQACKYEKKYSKIYSAKNIPQFNIYPFEFPWEKKRFDKNDFRTKEDTYWYDPIEFNIKIYKYSLYVFPIVKEIKSKSVYIYNLYNVNLFKKDINGLFEICKKFNIKTKIINKINMICLIQKKLNQYHLKMKLRE